MIANKQSHGINCNATLKLSFCIKLLNKITEHKCVDHLIELHNEQSLPIHHHHMVVTVMQHYDYQFA